MMLEKSQICGEPSYTALSSAFYLSKEQICEQLEKPAWRAISICTTKKGREKPPSLQTCKPKGSSIKVNQKD